MRKSSLPSNYRTRDVITARLHALRPKLEGEGIAHLALFGSVARGDDVPESDVDIVLEFAPERNPGLFRLAAITELLEADLGRSVDVAVRGSLRIGRHDEILADLYEVF